MISRIRYAELDWKLIGAFLALSLIGILTIYSSQHNSSDAYRQTFFLRQMVWLLIAFGGFLAVLLLVISTLVIRPQGLLGAEAAR